MCRLLKIDEEVVFYSETLPKRALALSLSLDAGSKAYDITGKELDAETAKKELVLMQNPAGFSSTLQRIAKNSEVGNSLIFLWREYCIDRGRELGISGQGIPMLQSMTLLVQAFQTGCLSEAADLIAQIPETEVITSQIKQNFVDACNSADLLKEL